MFKIKYGFTLSEIMVSLAVIAVLAAVMMPVISNARPNKHKALFKKAYYVAERIVYEIVNDDDIYPTNATSYGLDNTSEVFYLGNSYGSKDNEAAQKSKFCKIFARKVNTTSDSVSCDADHASFTNGYSFKTTDGIAWYMPYTDFKSTTTPPPAQIIRVDVNAETTPNCTYSETCPNPDRFEIKVEVDGKMYVDGEKEKEYLSSNDSLK